MEFESNVSLAVSTFEYNEDQDEYRLVLTHVFHGDTLNDALQYAISHLKTDVFFTGSMLGKLRWKGFEMKLAVHGQVVIQTGRKRQVDIEKILDELTEMAVDVHEDHRRLGILRGIDKLSEKEIDNKLTKTIVVPRI